MNSYLPDFHKVSKFFVWLIIIILTAGASFVVFVSIVSFRYTPDAIVSRFTSLIENPTQVVTDNEKKELQEITQSGFFADFGNENTIKTLRRISQGNPIIQSDVQYTGESKRTAQATLSFDNDFLNGNSKNAVIYMERYGSVLSGIKWQIFKIDLPREDTPIDSAQQTVNEVQDNINKGTETIIDRIKNAVNPN